MSPGFDLASAMNSFTDLAGRSGLTANAFGLDANSEIGVKRLQRVVGQLVKRRIDRMRDRDDQQRVAVGRCLRHQLGADDAAGAGLVLDDELLAEPLA